MIEPTIRGRMRHLSPRRKTSPGNPMYISSLCVHVLFGNEYRRPMPPPIAITTATNVRMVLRDFMKQDVDFLSSDWLKVSSFRISFPLSMDEDRDEE